VYGEALARDPDNSAAGVALGELLLAKYNNTEALETFRGVLARDPEFAPAILGLARSQHFDHSSEAMQTVEQSLAINPNLVPARAFLARLHMESERYQEAEREARRGLATNPNSLEALAVLAASFYIRDQREQFDATVARALAINPRYAELYNTLAELAVQNRLYVDAVELARQAVAIDSSSWRGYGLLGVNQMRIGEMQAGRRNLERAFAGDPFNVWIKNTLDLSDSLADYELVEDERFVYMLHRDESGILAPYLADLAEEAYERFRASYGYEPPGRIRVELYPDHTDFSVRTVGLAGIGLLGVSFGPVVALDSPAARPAGSFNWGSALWHELAHTFHLGMTRHRVPRWFSEGLAVHEEHRAREGWGSDMTPDFLAAYRDGALQPVSALNDGFVRPSYPEQIGYSYYQASLVFAFIEERWGYAVIPAMLEGYANGDATEAIVERILGISMAELDAAFDAYFRARFARALAALPAEKNVANPEDDFRRQMQTAGEAALEQDDERAEKHLLRAQSLFPEYADGDSAYWHLAHIYAKRGETAKAVTQLEQMIAINSDHYKAHLKLAELREIEDDIPGAADALARAVYIYPFDMALHQHLARLYGRMNEWPKAVREHQVVVALAPVDMAEARYELAHAHARAGQRREAKREVLRALEIAPSFPEALELLLEVKTDPLSQKTGRLPVQLTQAQSSTQTLEVPREH
jgi:tetratricopeptide (TPR) repeat protein